MGKRIITTEAMEEDIRTDYSLRPQTLDEYIGQEKAKENLKDLYSGGQSPGRISGSCAVLRTAGTGQDDSCRHYCQ